MSSSDASNNSPIKLFTVGKKQYSVYRLPIAKANEWLDRVASVMARGEELDKIESTAEQMAAGREWVEQMYACLFEYDPERLPMQEIIDGGATHEQLMDAFMTLREANDPFVSLKRGAIRLQTI